MDIDIEMKTFNPPEATGMITLTFHEKENKIITGHETGAIHRWNYSRYSNTLTLYDTFSSGFPDAIHFISEYYDEHFVTVNKNFYIEIHKPYCNDGGRICINGETGSIITPYGIQMLHDKLLAITGPCSQAWEAIDIWDLDKGVLEYSEITKFHRPHGVHMATTHEGFLLAVSCCSGYADIWKVNRFECTQICRSHIGRTYSIAVLPTGNFLTGSHDIRFYKEKSTEEFEIYKKIENGNVVDYMHPIGGDLILIIDRSSACSGTIKVWNYISHHVRTLGYSCIGSDVSDKHIVLEKSDAIVSITKDTLVIHKVKGREGAFKFPSGLAEIRKNIRILSQGFRTGSNLFALLPKEIIIRIALLTGGDLTEEEKEVSENLAWNCFGWKFKDLEPVIDDENDSSLE